MKEVEQNSATWLFRPAMSVTCSPWVPIIRRRCRAVVRYGVRASNIFRVVVPSGGSNPCAARGGSSTSASTRWDGSDDQGATPHMDRQARSRTLRYFNGCQLWTVLPQLQHHRLNHPLSGKCSDPAYRHPAVHGHRDIW